MNKKSANREIIRRVGDIYKWLDEQLAGQKAVCEICGRCCDFKAFDHRLYVTTPEMLYFVEKVERSNCHFDRSSRVLLSQDISGGEAETRSEAESPEGKSIKKDSSTSLRGVYPERSRRARNDIEMTIGRCSYRIDNKCSVYKYRFAGCRIFCCKGDAGFQSELTEAAVKKFKALCEKFQIPYRYVDLPTALKELIYHRAPKTRRKN